jgi:hypothetical protein
LAAACAPESGSACLQSSAGDLFFSDFFFTFPFFFFALASFASQGKKIP